MKGVTSKHLQSSYENEINSIKNKYTMVFDIEEVVELR